MPGNVRLTRVLAQGADDRCWRRKDFSVLTSKENLLRVIRHAGPEWVPNGMEACQFFCPPYITRPSAAGLDSWGVKWDLEDGAHGGTFPAHSGGVVSDISKWRSQISFPDLDAMDWSGVRWGWGGCGAALGAEDLDRNHNLLCGVVELGLFERSYLLLGMEQALMAYAAEQEAMADLVSALADFYVKLINRFADTIDMEMIWYGDDWGTQRDLFMPPATWRDIIKPNTKRIYDCIKARRILVNQHSCGRIESVCDDIVEMGADVWNPCQPCNDLAALKRRHAGRITFCGGIDSQFVLDRPDATPGDVRTEVRRRINDLAGGGGYIAGPSHGVPYRREIVDAMNDEINLYGHTFYRETQAHRSP